MEKRELIRKEILYYIEKNSRANLGELAVLLGTDEVTVANEIAEMEKDKVICGYHTLIDWDKAGVELVTALIEVRREVRDLTRLQSASATIRRYMQCI